jgi:hypothetical protein
MRRHITTALATGILALGLHGAAEAVTDGPTCKAECAPRIEQDCGAPGVRGFKKCKRRLVRACKATSPAVACATSGSRPGDGPDPGAGDPGSGNPDSGGPATDSLAAALADTIITVSSDSFFSSGSIVSTQVMALCASGSFHLDETRITSTSIGDVSSEESFDGTWSVRSIGGVQTLELVTGEPEPRRFAVAIENGQLLLDGKAPDVSPNTACGGASGGQPGGQGGDPVAQVTAALTDQVVVLDEHNAGFGTRTTSFALCASKRYLLDVEVSAVPGRVQEEKGNWSVRLDQGLPVLVLDADQAGETVFTISTDAQNNVLINGIVAQPGNPDAIAQVCPQL